MIEHTLITINAVIGENNVRSMTYITMSCHVPNNMSKSLRTTYDKKKYFIMGIGKKKNYFPGKNATKIRIMYHELCYLFHH